MTNKKPVRKDEMEYGYYSKLLQKPFDSIEELRKAEAEYVAQMKVKEDKAAAKREEARRVEEAFKALNAAKKACDTEVLESQKVCAKIIADAKVAHAQAVETARKKVDAAEQVYLNAMKEFTKKYPEGYHMTFRDGDSITSISRATYDAAVTDFYKAFLKLFD